jgi:predicted DNA-binding transcriptional regulator AlpA
MPDLNVEDIMNATSRERSTVLGWIHDGDFPGAYKLNGREWRIPQADWKACLNRERQGASRNPPRRRPEREPRPVAQAVRPGAGGEVSERTPLVLLPDQSASSTVDGRALERGQESIAQPRGEGAERIYEIARRIVDVGLNRDVSVFSAGRAVWMQQAFDELVAQGSARRLSHFVGGEPASTDRRLGSLQAFAVTRASRDWPAVYCFSR